MATGDITLLTAAVDKQTGSIDKLTSSVDDVADRVTRLETQVEERTRGMVREDTLRLAISEHLAECQTKKMDRQAIRGVKTSSWPAKPRQRADKAKLVGVVGGAGTGIAAAGYALWQLFEWIMSHPHQ